MEHEKQPAVQEADQEAADDSESRFIEAEFEGAGLTVNFDEKQTGDIDAKITIYPPHYRDEKGAEGDLSARHYRQVIEFNIGKINGRMTLNQDGVEGSYKAEYSRKGRSEISARWATLRQS